MPRCAPLATPPPCAIRRATPGAGSGSRLLLRDLRFGIRTLARNAGFSILAILVMGLGIGANVALFTVVHSVLLKPLPFKDQDRLVRLYEADAQGAFQDNVLAGGTFASWQSQAHSFEQMAIKRGIDYNLSGSGGQLPELVHGASDVVEHLSSCSVSKPPREDSSSPSDDRREADATVVLTWGLWKRRYGGDPEPRRQNHPARRAAVHGHWSSSRVVQLS